MLNFTFLTEDQIFGDKKLDILFGDKKLDILKEYGKKCIITDFSILLGGDVSAVFHTNEGDTDKGRTGKWWTRTDDGDNDACVVNFNGFRDSRNVDLRTVGTRPALPYSSISSIASNAVRESFGIKEVEYGEYPQTIVDERFSRELEENYKRGSGIRKTGKTYTTDSINWNDYDTSFEPRKHEEFEYNGRKYIRIVGDSNGEGNILSDGRTIELDKPYWILVEPIKWLVDERANIALSKKIIFSGVQFNNTYDYFGDFENTDIKRFMDNYFSKDIIPSIIKTKRKSSNKENITKKQNPYSFNFDEVSEEDIIKGAIESNVSVFLHGRSSEGKSARVKQLDPDCEIIYMRNATPDSLNGKSVYNAVTGEMIDVAPTWYKKVVDKCEAEPNKIHIIFFDELTNALPSIQGMAFNIILDGEVNGKWKLPNNARIVAAGNDLNDSLAANKLAEPLFNRFAHVYIETKVDSWLKWATTPANKYERLDYKAEEVEAKIHPSIYAYIAYKSYSGQDVLRTPYTGDKPNADPRKWEMASKVLYKTKNPEMLRALIGEDLTRDFVAFTKEQIITIEDVINHNYSDLDLNMDTSQKFATAVGLSSVDEKHFEIAREFMERLGAEPRAAFESMWAHGDDKRLEHIAEIHLGKSLVKGSKK